MCGIAGAIDFAGRAPIPESAIEPFMAPLRFRGPEHNDYVREESAQFALIFCHTRLKIIDLSEAGNQPMSSTSGNTVVVYNGAIYNFKELKAELESGGYTFQSSCDTEVLLNGYEAWGMEKLVAKLDGMFAFALFDRKSQRLFLARDPFGKKPLYYHLVGQRLIFSSDIRSFYGLGLDLTIDRHALGYYFRELTSPKDHSIWQQIKKFPPAHLLVFSASGWDVNEYWVPDFSQKNTLHPNDLLEQTDWLLHAAIKKRLVADVHIGAFLSGGIDSSLVASIMAEESSDPVRAYTIGYREQPFNELPFARKVAEKYGMEHRELIVEPLDVEGTESLIMEYGEPFADSSMIPTYRVSKEMAKHEKVALSGEGGDEIFAGYKIYEMARKLDQLTPVQAFLPVLRLWQKLSGSDRWDGLLKLVDDARLNPSFLLNRQMGFSDREMADLLPHDTLVHQALAVEHQQIWHAYGGTLLTQLDKTLACSYKTRLVNDYLVKVDRASMYASLEVRSPFLDKDLTQFAATIPAKKLMPGRVSKAILKQLAERYLPKELIHREKQGFEVPVGRWLRNELKPYFQEVVLSRQQSLVEFNYHFVKQLFNRHLQGEDHSHKLWSLYVFHRWAQNLCG